MSDYFCHAQVLSRFCAMLSLFLMPGCSTHDSASPPVGHERGFLFRTFVDENGDSHHYSIFVPYSYSPGDKLPVLLFLNGHGERGNDGVRQLSNNLGFPIWEMRDVFPMLVVAAQYKDGGRWTATSHDTKLALQILDKTIADFGADDDRVFLTGVSSGGAGAWTIASAYPERFAAVVPLCGVGSVDVDTLASQKMAIWSFYNSGDNQGLVGFNQRIREELIDRGRSPFFSEYPDTGHDCWNRAYRSRGLYRWLMEQSKANNAQETPFERLSAASILDDWDQTGGDTWGASDEGVLVGNSTDRSPASIECATDFTHVEFHGDVWMERGARCGIVFSGPERDRSQPHYLVEVMLPEDGGSCIFDAARKCLAQLDSGAQRSLWSDAWNDVRVELVDGRLKVRLNGWMAADLAVRSDAPRPQKLKVALVAPRDGSEVRWRMLRWRGR